MINVIVAGICGRMGIMIARAVLEADGMDIAGGTERAEHPFIGRDIGGVLGQENIGKIICDDVSSIADKSDVIIDFTSPDSTMNNLKAALLYKKGIVIGTTGLGQEQKHEIEKAGKNTSVLMAPNMSIGVNLIFSLLGDIARKLGEEYDIEIIETHHRFKKDAPSGTAMRMAEILADASNRDLSKIGTYGRHGLLGERKKDEIAVHAVRSGDVVGEHTVVFGTLGERIEITHKAHNRGTFALGAIAAAKFIASRQNGFYSMQDVLMC